MSVSPFRQVPYFNPRGAQLIPAGANSCRPVMEGGLDDSPERRRGRAVRATLATAWTGNDPQRLAAFYSDDALYVDPGIRAGAHGKLFE